MRGISGMIFATVYSTSVLTATTDFPPVNSAEQGRDELNLENGADSTNKTLSQKFILAE